ncbi:hypothetical protein M9H77_28768 [Catharanthus roseus]|uniref:Uncharacterized protein n=1 Tax=Catharanthus roseus TaxID=4058 RepID=A0ACC0AI75_CATRO|nr:hypothetical protein M9H77_28768 [Catharanthus roseus]
MLGSVTLDLDSVDRGRSTIGGLDPMRLESILDRSWMYREQLVPGVKGTPSTESSSSMAPFTDPAAWKPLPGDTHQLLTLNVDRVFSGVDRGWLYGAGAEAAHLRVESSWAAAILPPCCLEAEKRIMRQVEATVSSAYTAFEEHMRRFAEHSNLSYTPMPPMMDVDRNHHRQQQLQGLQM